MKIASLFCPCDNAVHGTDHYSAGLCTNPPMPLPWMLGIQGNLTADKFHQGFKITATRLLACPMQTAIEGLLSVIEVDLRHFNSMTWGSAVHAFCEKYAPPGSYVETQFPRPGQPTPVLFAGTDAEIAVAGKADYISPDVALLIDYKCTSEASLSFKMRGPDGDLCVQFSVYVRIIEQSIEDAKIKRCQVWHGGLITAGGRECRVCKRGGLPPWVSFDVPTLTDEEILAHKPGGGDTTVREIVLSYKRLSARLAAIGPQSMIDSIVASAAEGKETNPGIDVIEAAIREEMPLAGRTMWNGKKCPKYCTARPTCDRLQGITAGLASFSG